MSLSSTAISLTPATAGDNIVIAGQTGQTIRVMSVLLDIAGTTNVTFKDGTTAALSGALPMVANGSIILDERQDPWYVTSPGNGFNINSSAGVNITGTIWYTQS